MAAATATLENRRWSRGKFESRVIWVQGSGSTVRGAVGRACDISEGGISAVLPARIEIGEIGEAQFTLPGVKEALRMQVVVRNCEGFRYGLEFLALSHAQRMTIRRACEMLAVLAH